MKVKEALEHLQALVDAGHGDLELYAVRESFDDAYALDVHNLVNTRCNKPRSGALGPLPEGTKYVPVYLEVDD